MPREVDDKKTKRVLRKIARAKAKAAEGGEDVKFSDWESEFVESVEGRLETFGSAFNDPEKGALSEPLSSRQGAKLREIDKKASGKARKPMSRGKGFQPKPGGGFKQSSFKNKSSSGPRVRDINDDIIGAVGDTPSTPKAEPMPRVTPAKPKSPGTVRSAPSKPRLVKPDDPSETKPNTPSEPTRPVFRVVKGGKGE